MMFVLFIAIFCLTQGYYGADINNLAGETETRALETFFDGCGTTKRCFGSPLNCVNSRNCTAAVAITVSGNFFDFELRGNVNAGWVGVGLSSDALMGNDSVIECTKDQNNVIAAYMSWTTARPHDSTRLSNPQLGIQLRNSSSADGLLYCNVRRNETTNVNGVTFDLRNDQYHLLIAAGTTFTATSVNRHDITRLASTERQNVDITSGAPKILASLPICLIVMSLFISASVGSHN